MVNLKYENRDPVCYGLSDSGESDSLLEEMVWFTGLL
jgi:hypothetical protein